MSRRALVPALVSVLVLALIGWVVHNTRWEEVEVDDQTRGAAAADQDYALRRILTAAGATLHVRTSLEPMPPAGATLLLESSFWNIFPERDARLKGWVESGGHLVGGTGVNLAHETPDLAWVPLSTAQRIARSRESSGRASPPAIVASEAGTGGSVPRPKAPELFRARRASSSCHDFTETDTTATPAYEPGRVFRGCAAPIEIHVLGSTPPTWTLAIAPGARVPFTAQSRTLATRVAVGRGSVTKMTPFMDDWNHALLEGDNALIVAAILQAAPGRAIWIVRDEAREPLAAWLWHEARTPSLLALAAIALALWRLMVRFGPREAVPPRARRSMGEQVRGTGHFIAGTDARALHAATRQAFEAVARRRVEGWAELDDAARIEALAASLPHPQAIDRAALRASMNIGGGATPAQVVAAIAALEQARRALLRTGAAASH